MWDLTLKKQVLTALRWTLAGKATAQLLSWIITIVVIRILAPSDYGLMAMSEVVFSFLIILSTAGMGAAIVQAREIDETQIRKVFGMLLVVGAILFSAQLLLAPVMANYYREPRITALIQVQALGFLIIPFSTIPSSFLSKAMNFKRTSLVEVAAIVSGSMLTLGLALAGAGVWSLIFGQLAQLLVSAVALNASYQWKKIPLFSFAGAEKLLNFGGVLTLTTMVWFFFSKADVLIGGRALGPEMLGIYAVAYHLASLPMVKIVPLLNQIAFPAYARIQDNPVQANNYFLKSVRTITLISFPLFFGLAAIAHEFVELVLGDKWQSVAAPLILLCFLMPLLTIYILFAPVLYGLGRPQVELGNGMLALIIMPAAFLIGVRFGVLGLCLAWIIAFPVVFCLACFRFLKAIGLPPSHLARAVGPSAFSAVLMYLVIFLGKSLLPEEVNGGVELICLVVAGALMYLSTTWVLFNQRLLEFLELVRVRS